MTLKDIRMSTSMTQEDVANLLGVKRSTVAMWETGAAYPSTAKLPDVAKVYCVTAEKIIETITSAKQKASAAQEMMNSYEM